MRSPRTTRATSHERGHHRSRRFGLAISIVFVGAVLPILPTAAQNATSTLGGPDVLPPLPESGFGVPSVGVPPNAVSTVLPSTLGQTPSLRLPSPGAGITPLQQNEPSAPAILIQPQVTIGAALTDNARQTINRTSDLEGRLAPGLSISADTPRLQGVFQGQFEYDKYAITSDQDQLFANVFANGLVTAVPDHLFIDVNSAVFEASRSGAIGFAPVTQAVPKSQLTQTYATSLSPYLRESYKGLVDTELRYRLSTTNFSGNTGTLVTTPGLPAIPAISDSISNEGTLTVATGRDFERLLSKLTLDASKLDAGAAFGNSQVTGYDDVEYRITPTIAALGRVGYENIHYASTSTLTSASAVGVLWQVGGRVELGPNYAALQYGKQEGIYGFSGSLRYEITPTTVLTASASQGLSSTQQDIQNALVGASFDPYGRIVDQYNLPTAFVNPEFALENAIFRSRQYRAGVTTSIGPNRFFLFGFYDRRVSLGTGSGSSAPSTSVGANFSWSRDIHPDLNGSISFGFANVSNTTFFSAPTFPVVSLLGTTTTFVRNGNTMNASLGLNYLFNDTLRGSVTYNFLYETGVATSNSSTIGDVVVNRLEVALTKSF